MLPDKPRAGLRVQARRQDLRPAPAGLGALVRTAVAAKAQTRLLFRVHGAIAFLSKWLCGAHVLPATDLYTEVLLRRV